MRSNAKNRLCARGARAGEGGANRAITALRGIWKRKLDLALSCVAVSFFLWSGWQFVSAKTTGAATRQADESTAENGGPQPGSLMEPFVKPLPFASQPRGGDDPAARSDGEPTPIVLGNANTDFPVMADFDGDKKIDIAVTRSDATNRSFIIRRSSDGVVQTVPLGLTDDRSHVTGDWDGDNKADPAVFRCAASATPCSFIYRSSMSGSDVTQQWGTGSASIATPTIAYPGDFDGDGKFDLCVYTFATGVWKFELKRSSDGNTESIEFGNFATDYIIPGDYDGDGKTDFMLGRTGGSGSSPIQWILLTRTGSGPGAPISFGISTDLPVTGDYDGDGKDDIAVRRRSDSTFRVRRSSDGASQVLPLGLTNDFAAGQWNVQ